MEDKKLFVANWKSHKNYEDVAIFFEEINAQRQTIDWNNKTVVISPPFPLLEVCKNEIEKYNLPFLLSSQDISAFSEGAYTGEVSAFLVKEYASYSIIGHSERREYFNEKDDLLEKKVNQALQNGIIPIYCVQSETQTVPRGVSIVAFEPISAIGTGSPDDPVHIEQVFEELINANSSLKVLYGGSISPENILEFINIKNLSGFLVGGASLTPGSFMSLLSKW